MYSQSQTCSVLLILAVDAENTLLGEHLSLELGIMGTKRKLRTESTKGMDKYGGNNSEVQAKAKGNAVKDLFEGNYEDRRNFGVVDIFDTLGLAVSQLRLYVCHRMGAM